MSEDTTSAAAQLRVMRQEDIPAGLRLTRASHWNQLARDWELFLDPGADGCPDRTFAIAGPEFG